MVALPEMQGREVPIDNRHDTPIKLKSFDHIRNEWVTNFL